MNSLEQAKALAAELHNHIYGHQPHYIEIIQKHMEAFAKESRLKVEEENIRLGVEASKLREANRELLKDEERLDLLEQMKTDYQCTSGDWDWFVVLPHIREHESYGAIRTFSTLREALDKAALAKERTE